MKCAVIGSGIGGIAIAVRLRAMGHDVDVYERNGHPGGKIRELHRGGFRFDMGPTVFTMPHLLDELFVLGNKNPRDYYSYTKLTSTFHYFYGDGSCVRAYADPKPFLEELREKTGEPEKNILRFKKKVEAIYRITKEVFIENSLHVLGNWFTYRIAYGLINFHRIGAFKTMHASNRNSFHSQKLVQLFDYYASYIGSSPLKAPSTLNLISHITMDGGVFMPRQGMYSVVESLVKLAQEMGVKFYVNTGVEGIRLDGNKVTGIHVPTQGDVPYDRVVSNMDIHYTYNRLLPSVKKPVRILGQPRSSSVIAFYWGVKGIHEGLGIHNVLFSDSGSAEYEDIFDRGTLSDDPTIYWCITSKHNPADAPEGCENWMVLVTVPHDQGQDWNTLVQQTRGIVLKKIKNKLHIDLAIVQEHFLSPPEIDRNYASYQGSIYGNSSNGIFSAFLRHPNFTSQVKGLYFVGGTVHPGAGIPMCLHSAKIVGKVFK